MRTISQADGPNPAIAYMMMKPCKSYSKSCFL